MCAHAAPHRRRRDSARVVVLDDRGAVLLFEIHDDGSGQTFWVTPGGGVEEGESPQQAARRELLEETGYAAGPDELVGPVARCHGEWAFRGTPLFGTDSFFACRVGALEVARGGWTELEREVTRSWRWWRPDELDATAETVFPLGLASLARDLHRGEVPRTPRELAWGSLRSVGDGP